MNNVVVRAISGAAYVAIVVACVLLGKWTMMALSFVFAFFALLELSAMQAAKTGEDSNPFSLSADITGAFLMIAAAYMPAISLVAVTLFCYVALWIVRLVYELYAKNSNPITEIASSFMGQLYVAFPLALLGLLYCHLASAHIILAMFIFIWLNDTGAFCVGSLFGRHRLFERISPKKSWEGFWGGLAFCIIAAILFYYLFDNYFESMSVITMVIMAVVVSVAATFGDLVESLLKRTAGVKDSGNIMPGHGGILDRIDSLLFVAPALFCLFVLFPILKIAIEECCSAQ